MLILLLPDESYKIRRFNFNTLINEEVKVENITGFEFTESAVKTVYKKDR